MIYINYQLVMWLSSYATGIDCAVSPKVSLPPERSTTKKVRATAHSVMTANVHQLNEVIRWDSYASLISVCHNLRSEQSGSDSLGR
ncbi:hypothetical protein D3C71_1339930 [compost metagenome]